MPPTERTRAFFAGTNPPLDLKVGALDLRERDYKETSVSWVMNSEMLEIFQADFGVLGNPFTRS